MNYRIPFFTQQPDDDQTRSPLAGHTDCDWTRHALFPAGRVMNEKI
jgi:hypothetical protein